MSDFDFTEIERRVTIGDILQQCGIKPRGNRIPCPIHGGSNPTAFRFTNSVFHCFACGAKGGLLDLVEYLLECSRREALQKLCNWAGISPPAPRSAQSSPTIRVSKRISISQTELDCLEAENRLEWAKSLRNALETCLRIARRACKQGRMSLSDFYLKEQTYLEELNEADELIGYLKYELKRKRKVLHEKHS